jgi:hypothetical protein
MALIAVSTDDPGIARIFFDLRAINPTLDEADRIAAAIEHAFAVADQQVKSPEAPSSESMNRALHR